MSVDLLLPARTPHRPPAPRTPAPHPSRARLRQHPPRPWTVDRPRLLQPLVGTSRPLATLLAPAGSGKTTLLAQWRERDPRPFAWVTLTSRDDEPRHVLDAVGAALCTVQPLPAETVAPGARLDDVLRALGSLRPAVLVLDDVHLIPADVAAGLLGPLADHVPPGVTLAVAARGEPPLSLARRRAQDDVVEIRGDALAMTRDEAAALLRHLGLRLAPAHLRRLLSLTGGWPALLRLAAHVLAEQPDAGAALSALAGDPAVAGYVADEILAGLPAADRTLLREASALDRLNAPMSEAVLGGADAFVRLRAAGSATGVLEAVDRAAVELRPHPLLGQALRRELHDREPARAQRVHRRASTWYERQGDTTRAVEHAIAADDAPRIADLVVRLAPGLAGSGDRATLASWPARLAPGVVGAHPGLAVAAALERCVAGDRDTAEHWAAQASERTRAEDPVVAAGLDVVRAALARDGLVTAARDAARARKRVPDSSPWRAYACLLEGALAAVGGRADAPALLHAGARGAVVAAPLVRALCLSVLAFLAIEEGDRDEAESHAGAGRAAVERGAPDEALGALSHAVAGLVMASQGRLDAARRDSRAASDRLALLPDPPAWYGALTRIALARTALRLSEAGDARRLLGEAERLARQMPEATALHGWLAEAQRLADDFVAGPVSCPSALTLAELRVLRLLPSHLTFREIAARLQVSSNTVKTQAHAVYRKLDACSRSEAVAHATAMGLLDAEITRTG
jgi:LuxR family maltose regulon positive regulatory protein